MRTLPVLLVLFVFSACNCGGDAHIGGEGGNGGNGGSGGAGNGQGGSGNGQGGSGNGQGGAGNGQGGSGGTGGGVVDLDAGDFDPDDSGVPFYDGGCGPIDGGNPPLPRRCGPPTTSECDNTTDQFLTARGVSSTLLNGQTGNGYDDDCDGLADEGCSCPGNGQTKDCWLVPATQADSVSKQPVGWCTTNAKGSLDCAGGELASWSGVCRGANRPVRHDSCAPGDFNCDGLSGNNDIAGCSCPADVVCPSAAITLAPFPSPTAIPLVDGSAWIGAASRALATNWTWTVLGGDCDNVLPFPTFALYNGASSTAANARKGTRTPVKFDMNANKYVATPGEPLIAIQAVGFGNGVAGGQLHPAFGLSGDYSVQGEFDLGGQHYVCTQKVQVRAPGIRAELCWDTVGGDNGTNGNDIDLHFARLQGTSCANKGWDGLCNNNTVGELQDCYYSSASGCPSGDPGWGYGDSATTACHGWGSKRDPTEACVNPRLDRDNVTCDRTQADPVSTGTDFCGPENINLDNPKNNDRFIIGVNHYLPHPTGASPNARPHVNIYCNGARVLSVGYNPATGQQFPLLTRGGSDTTGDFWNAAVITAHVTGTTLDSCDVETIPSHHADMTRDGPAAMAGAGNAICVESQMNMSSPMFNYTSHKFVDANSQQGLTAGAQPTTAAQFCKH